MLVLLFFNTKSSCSLIKLQLLSLLLFNFDFLEIFKLLQSVLLVLEKDFFIFEKLFIDNFSFVFAFILFLYLLKDWLSLFNVFLLNKYKLFLYLFLQVL